MDITPAGRLRLEVRQDKPYHHQHQDDRQKHKGNNDDSNDYRTECFHHAPYRDYVHLPVESTPVCSRVDPLSGSYQGLWPLPAGLKSCS